MDQGASVQRLAEVVIRAFDPPAWSPLLASAPPCACLHTVLIRAVLTSRLAVLVPLHVHVHVCASRRTLDPYIQSFCFLLQYLIF